jgi:hypothetical protein
MLNWCPCKTVTLPPVVLRIFLITSHENYSLVDVTEITRTYGSLILILSPPKLTVLWLWNFLRTKIVDYLEIKKTTQHWNEPI